MTRIDDFDSLKGVVRGKEKSKKKKVVDDSEESEGGIRRIVGTRKRREVRLGAAVRVEWRWRLLLRK
jgi:hypothetical protein